MGKAVIRGQFTLKFYYTYFYSLIKVILTHGKSYPNSIIAYTVKKKNLSHFLLSRFTFLIKSLFTFYVCPFRSVLYIGRDAHYNAHFQKWVHTFM